MAQHEKLNRQPIPLTKDKKEYHRIKYSLKMALRMINGTFDQFDVDQYGKDALDDDFDKTIVESWYMAENTGEEKDKKIPIEMNLPFLGDGEHSYQDIKTGSIVKSPSEIKLNETTIFYVFRVVVGRAIVIRSSTLMSEEYLSNPRSALHPEYDSIYIQDDSAAGQNDYVSHKYRVFDKEKVRLVYKVTAKIRITNSVESHVPLCE